jgi:hypothetical protein
MTSPHIQAARPSSVLAGQYALQGRDLPSELYQVFLQADSFNESLTYWLRRSSSEALVKVKIEGHLRTGLPPELSAAALTIDSASVQPFSFWVGNTAAAAVQLSQNASSNIRYKILISIA